MNTDDNVSKENRTN